MPVFRAGADHAAADAVAHLRRALHDPVHHVVLVHVLLDDVIAGEPDEIGQLRICYSHGRTGGLPRRVRAALDPVALAGDDRPISPS